MGRKAKSMAKQGGTGPPEKPVSKFRSRGPNKVRRPNSRTTEPDSGEAAERGRSDAPVIFDANQTGHMFNRAEVQSFRFGHYAAKMSHLTEARR